MEFVFVVPRSALFPDFYPHGLVPFGSGLARESFDAALEAKGYFVEREHAERDCSLKQVIPYSIVVRDGEVLLLRRTKSGGDSRLFDKLSIGVGGHVNPEDALADDGRTRVRNPIAACTRRELNEELDIRSDWSLRPIGIMNDDSNSVGAVHVGLVQIVYARGAVTIREEDILQGRFEPVSELLRLRREGANFESWSAKLVEFLEHAPADLLREPSVALA